MFSFSLLEVVKFRKEGSEKISGLYLMPSQFGPGFTPAVQPTTKEFVRPSCVFVVSWI